MDPLDAFNRWQNWRVEGTPSQLAAVLARLDANLPTGWRKLDDAGVPGLELLVRDGAGLHRLDATPEHIGVSLGVVPVPPSGLRGGQVWFGSPRPPAKSDLPLVWEQILRFVEGGIAPAARTVGAGVCVPSTADLFFADLPLDIRDRLVTFSSRSGKTLPLRRDTIGLWHEFVLAAFRSRTRAEGESLRVR